MKMRLHRILATIIANTDALQAIHSKNSLGTYRSFPFKFQTISVYAFHFISFLFFGCGGDRHRFSFDQDISIFHKLSITSRYYETHVVPRSYTTPHLLMFYADWCFSCMKVAGAFKKIKESLEPLGFVFATVNAGHEANLARKASVHVLPCLILVLDGKNYVFKENSFVLQIVVDFIRQKLPYKMIVPINDNNVNEFLSGWSDNRVRALIMEPRKQIRLRYLNSAFQFRQRVLFG